MKQSLEYHKLHLRIAREVEDEIGEGLAYYEIGLDFESRGSLCERDWKQTTSGK